MQYSFVLHSDLVKLVIIISYFLLLVFVKEALEFIFLDSIFRFRGVITNKTNYGHSKSPG